MCEAGISVSTQIKIFSSLSACVSRRMCSSRKISVLPPPFHSRFVHCSLYGLLRVHLCFSVFIWTLVLALVFLSVCMDSCACSCVSQCLYGLLCVHLCFSVFIWTLVLALAFLSVCMDSCACTCVSQCLYGLLCLLLRFSAFVWTLVHALVFLSVYMDSCACVSHDRAW